MNEIYTLIEAECQRQLAKWGEQHHPATFWMLILMEEVGEVAKALLEGEGAVVIDELIQVAAVIVTWLRSGDLNE